MVQIIVSTRSIAESAFRTLEGLRTGGRWLFVGQSPAMLSAVGCVMALCDHGGLVRQGFRRIMLAPVTQAPLVQWRGMSRSWPGPTRVEANALRAAEHDRWFTF